MKTLFLAISLGLILFANMAEAETLENVQARCQRLAHDFAEDPGSLKVVRLRQLQFCINQTIAQREANIPPNILKGTVIQPLAPSESESLSVPPEVRNGD